jgi:hypothetical protein
MYLRNLLNHTQHNYQFISGKEKRNSNRTAQNLVATYIFHGSQLTTETSKKERRTEQS